MKSSTDSWFSLFLWPAFRRIFLVGKKLEVSQELIDGHDRRTLDRRSRRKAAGVRYALGMNDSYCPLGSLREEAQRTAAIGLRIAWDSMGLRWSWQAQTRFDEAQKTANQALAAWKEHIRDCQVCRGTRSELLPGRTKSEFGTNPTVLLVDDNQALLELLVGILQPTYNIAATSCNGSAVVDQAAALLPDLIILDISLGEVSGFEVARRLKKAGCPAKIIFLTIHEDTDFADVAFGLGASGYVFKSRLATDLENAIAIVLSGGLFSSIR
jgi:CheY-like chemotaxis protein